MPKLRNPYRAQRTHTKALAPISDRTPAPITEASPGKVISGGNLATYLGAFGGDQPIDWAYICARLIAESAAGADYHFENEQGKRFSSRRVVAADGSAESGVDLAPKDLISLIESPNPWMGREELIQLLVIDLLFTGDHFWFCHLPDAEGKPESVWRLRPDMVDVIPGESRLIAGYRWRAPGNPSKPIEIPADQILHFKLPNPHSPFRGMGVIQAAARAMDIDLALTDATATFFEQGTHLGGVVTTDRRVPDPVFQKIKRQFAAMYSGRRNAGKVAILESGLKFQAIQPTPADAMFGELQKLSRDRIFHAFRVPPPLVGNMENANYKMAEAQRIFDTKTMPPILSIIARVLSNRLTQAWGLNLVFDYEYVMPDEDRLKLAESFATLPGVKVAEVRRQAGLDPLGDERDNIVLNLPSEEDPNRNLASQGGRPPNGENVPALPAPGEPLPAGAAARRALPPAPEDAKAPRAGRLPRVAKIKRPQNERDELVARLDRTKPVRDAAQSGIAADLRPKLGAAADALLADITDSLSGVKAPKNEREAELLAALAPKGVFSRFAEAVRAALIPAAITSINRATEHSALQGINLPEAATRLDPELVRRAALDLANREDGVKSISGTIRERVVREIREGARRGYTPGQILAGVESESYRGIAGLIDDWKAGQAETIARTEAAVYYNEGTLRTAEAAGLPDDFLVLDGEDWDEPCRLANGEIWTAAEARASLVEHPNCVRAFLPITVTAPA